MQIRVDLMPPELVELCTPVWNKLTEDARMFLTLWAQYIELADDLIDEPTDKEKVRAFIEFGPQVFSCNFWLQHGVNFWLLERVICLTYNDTVDWEKAEEKWMRVDAKALSHCGYDMFFAVIIFQLGYKTAQSISRQYREYAHRKHSHDEI